jgi:hypothetical protein
MQRTRTRGYVGDAEVFLVYCHETRGLYAVPVSDAPTRYMYLRLEPTLNGQMQRIRWASDYELPA